VCFKLGVWQAWIATGLTFDCLLSQEHYRALNLQLTDQEISAIAGLNRDLRFNDPAKLWGPEFSIFDDSERNSSQVATFSVESEASAQGSRISLESGTDVANRVIAPSTLLENRVSGGPWVYQNN
jgi:hypothetical protein